MGGAEYTIQLVLFSNNMEARDELQALATLHFFFPCRENLRIL